MLYSFRFPPAQVLMNDSETSDGIPRLTLELVAEMGTNERVVDCVPRKKSWKLPSNNTLEAFILQFSQYLHACVQQKIDKQRRVSKDIQPSYKWLADWLNCCLTHWLFDWLAVWLIDWLIDWLTDLTRFELNWFELTRMDLNWSELTWIELSWVSVESWFNIWVRDRAWLGNKSMITKLSFFKRSKHANLSLTYFDWMH